MEWHHLRHKLASKVVSPSLGTKIVEELSLVSDELIEKLRRDRDSNLGTIAQFEKYVYRFDLEGIRFQLTLLHADYKQTCFCLSNILNSYDGNFDE